MGPQTVGETLAIVTGGLDPDFKSKLGEVCCDCERYELRAHAFSPEELLDAIEAVGRAAPVLILVSGEWIKQEGLELLVEMRQLVRDAMVLLVGADLESLAIGHALRLGLRGLADPRMNAQLLQRALEVVALGELWMSRQLLMEVVGLLAPPELDAHMDVWLNLPALTQREHDVLKEVLDGKSNKAIANELDISEQTVKIHLQHVYRKLGVHRRVDLLKAFSESRPAA